MRLVIAGPDFGRAGEIQSRAQRDPGPAAADRPHLRPAKTRRPARCGLLLPPQRPQGFSLAVLESLACGTPVVISPECHFPQVAESGTGLIPGLDPTAIAAAIDRMLIDPGLRAQASIAASNLIDTGYTWKQVAEHMIAAYG